MRKYVFFFSFYFFRFAWESEGSRMLSTDPGIRRKYIVLFPREKEGFHKRSMDGDRLKTRRRGRWRCLWISTSSVTFAPTCVVSPDREDRRSFRWSLPPLRTSTVLPPQYLIVVMVIFVLMFLIWILRYRGEIIVGFMLINDWKRRYGLHLGLRGEK